MLAKNTKKALRKAATRTLLALGTIVGVMSMVGTADAAETGIRATRHNLSPSGTGTNKITNTGGEICVFCHTPHGAATSSAAPLWNKKIADSTTYTEYSSSTLDGTVSLAGSVSLGCLTCHDGTQAMDTVLNAPGSGGYDSDGARMKTSGGVNLTWQGDAAGTGKIGQNGITNLGTDLSNDHPVGIPYAKWEGAAAADLKDADFNEATKISGKSVWYVETSTKWTGITGATSGKDKYDMILYTKTDGKPYVECASCHDPHTENQTFLRITNDGSRVCLTCHNK
jgi:predicted CXXCH cytochrome family protein